MKDGTYLYYFLVKIHIFIERQKLYENEKGC